MNIQAPAGRDEITLRIPDDAEIFLTAYPVTTKPAVKLVLDAVRAPLGTPPLLSALASRRPGDVVVVVSDFTRPIPYRDFLAPLLAEIASSGVPRSKILLLVATGMHRPSSVEERREMFGEEVVERYRIEDHRAEDNLGLAAVAGRSASGATIRLNRRFVEAGFRIVTGLVEPHFMAGYSGGRKTVCPGLASLDTVRNFHGAKFLADPNATNAVLAGNPLHEEALSVSRAAGVDFTLNVVLDRTRRLVRAYAGALEPAHEAACEFVRACAVWPVRHPADIVLTGCGGYPLDATFYQCVKGFVSCLPAVREGGTVIAFGGCAEGVGSREYAGLLKQYAGRFDDFMAEIGRPGVFTKDQWELQMQDRALAKVGAKGLHFVSDGLSAEALTGLTLTGHPAEPGKLGPAVQAVLDEALSRGGRLAVFPEGPYCVPEAAADIIP
ncbi:MAG: nickel-dependent lactate racemase [Candidatus Aminicenantes bacterium]|nr:nickel-dependent lactate racemase [Candidatus Aminicenantes bacterium]